jgi:hypothetical protein
MPINIVYLIFWCDNKKYIQSLGGTFRRKAQLGRRAWLVWVENFKIYQEEISY